MVLFRYYSNSKQLLEIKNCKQFEENYLHNQLMSQIYLYLFSFFIQEIKTNVQNLLTGSVNLFLFGEGGKAEKITW